MFSYPAYMVKWVIPFLLVVAGVASVQAGSPALAKQTITFSVTANAIYGDAPLTLNASASSGLPVTFSVSGPGILTGNTLALTGAGSVKIKASQPGDTRFQAAAVERSIKVSPALLTVTADSLSRFVNQPNPPLTFSYAGFVNGDTSSILEKIPSTSTSAKISSPAGSYPIKVSAGKANNYAFKVLNGTLTVQSSSFGGGGLTVSGAGTLVLGGGSSYSGDATMITRNLTIGSGTLSLSEAYTQVADGTLTVASGTLSGTPSFGRALTISTPNQTAQVGVPVTFHVPFLSAFSYRWKVSTDHGFNWSFLSDDGIYSGTQTNSLTLSSTTLEMNGWKFLCEMEYLVETASPPTVVVNPGTLTVY
jgi:autotransporter-associated beta strand protein